MSDSYYVLRLGSVFRIIYMDDEAVSAWNRGGWELRSYATNAEAQTALEKWKASISHKPSIPVYRRQAVVVPSNCTTTRQA
jgi:hypothetical protein